MFYLLLTKGWEMKNKIITLLNNELKDSIDLPPSKEEGLYFLFRSSSYVIFLTVFGLVSDWKLPRLVTLRKFISLNRPNQNNCKVYTRSKNSLRIPWNIRLCQKCYQSFMQSFFIGKRWPYVFLTLPICMCEWRAWVSKTFLRSPYIKYINSNTLNIS